jgi:hypothetical protein
MIEKRKSRTSVDASHNEMRTVGRGKPKTARAPASAAHMRRLKTAEQRRQREALGSGRLSPQDMMFIKPEQLIGARVVWPTGSLTDRVPAVSKNLPKKRR